MILVGTDATDKTLYLLNSFGQFEWELICNNEIYEVDITRDGNYLVAISQSDLFYHNRSNNYSLIWRTQLNRMFDVRISQDGEFLVVKS